MGLSYCPCDFFSFLKKFCFWLWVSVAARLCCRCRVGAVFGCGSPWLHGFAVGAGPGLLASRRVWAPLAAEPGL